MKLESVLAPLERRVELAVGIKEDANTADTAFTGLFASLSASDASNISMLLECNLEHDRPSKLTAWLKSTG